MNSCWMRSSARWDGRTAADGRCRRRTRKQTRWLVRLRGETFLGEVRIHAVRRQTTAEGKSAPEARHAEKSGRRLLSGLLALVLCLTLVPVI